MAPLLQLLLQLPQLLLKLLNLLLYDPSRQVLSWNSALKCLDPPRQVLQQLVSQLAPSAQLLLALAEVEAINLDLQSALLLLELLYLIQQKRHGLPYLLHLLLHLLRGSSRDLMPRF